MKINNRINNISEYHFKKLDDIKQKLNNNNNKELFDFSIGDPDLPVDNSIIEEFIKSLNRKKFNNYAPYDGIKELKLQIIKYYEDVFSVKLNLNEVIVLIGSKEGISNIIPAICDFGDYNIIPNPGYPVYESCSKLWGVNSYKVPLKENKNFLPQFDCIPKDIINKSKLFIINYPNNPTGAVANEEFYKGIINFCKNNNIVLCNDAAYNEIIEENKRTISLLQFDKEKNSIEFGTMSKIYNMTGFRIGYAVGNSKVIERLLTVKSNVDSGQFKPIQYAAIEALKLSRNYVNNIRKIYDNRRKIAKKILKEKNIEYFDGKGTFYIWGKVPKEYTCDEFCSEIMKDTGIIFTPGFSFGNLGYNYFRISLTQDEKTIKTAFNKLKVYKKLD